MTAASPPWVTMLLIAYNQQSTIAEAIAGALAQTYSPLEIIVSDDASTDATWSVMQAAVADYHGAHQVRVNRNPVNLGIGAHLSHAARIAQGELLFVAAGDDVSLPQRCATVVDAWLAHERRPDLIASALIDIDERGTEHARIEPARLQDYASVADWLARPPHVIGAAQAWTRRLIDRFGPLPQGVVAEDLIMVFRAIGSGGALTLPDALVRYRRGGISRRVRNLRARDVIERVLKNNRHALVEHEQLLRDAGVMNQLDVVGATLEQKLRRERYIRDLFGAEGMARKAGLSLRAAGVPGSLRLRMFFYAAMPWVYAPFFFLKRAASRKS